MRFVFLLLVLAPIAAAQWVVKSQQSTAPAQCNQTGVFCAASCGIVDVKKAISLAQPGNTVVLPACINTTPGLTLCATPNQTCGGALATNEWNQDIGLSPNEGQLNPPTSLKHINIIGQGVGQTVIIDSNPKTGTGCEALISVDDSYSPPSGIMLPSPTTPGLTDPIRISGMTIIENTVDITAQCYHIQFYTGSHALHVDHIDIIGLTSKDTGISVSGDPWGVIDDITMHATATSYVDRAIAVHHQNWQAIGTFSDNTWAQPPTYGTNQQMYIERVTLDYNGGVWCEFGGRCTVRNSNFTYLTTHGTESGQRVRSGRFFEVYNNKFSCTNKVGGAHFLSSYRGGTWILWGNDVEQSAGCYTAQLAGAVASYYRSFDRFVPWGPLQTSPPTPLNSYVRGACDGTGQFDQNTTPVANGIADASSTINKLVVLPSPGWPVNQWVGYGLNNATGGAPPVQTSGTACTPNPPNGNVNANGTTGPWGSYIIANDDHTITTSVSQYNATASCQAGGAHAWAAGDTFYITNNFNQSNPIASQCIDEPGHGSGALLSGGWNNQPWNCQPGNNGTGPSCTPNPGQVCRDGPGTCGWVNQALDPAYSWLNTINLAAASPFITVQTNGSTVSLPMVQYNREIYNDGPPSPFTGANLGPTSQTGGVGVGTFAAMPATCQPQVAYWATDKQILYWCSAPNTWTVHYQPYTYPHPLTLQALRDRLGRIIETGDGHTLIRIAARQLVRKVRRQVRRRRRQRQRRRQQRRRRED